MYVRCRPKDDVQESSSFYPVAISVRGCRQITICICRSRQKALLSVPVLLPDGAGSAWDGSWWGMGPSSSAPCPAVPAGSLPLSPLASLPGCWSCQGGWCHTRPGECPHVWELQILTYEGRNIFGYQLLCPVCCLIIFIYF